MNGNSGENGVQKLETLSVFLVSARTHINDVNFPGKRRRMALSLYRGAVDEFRVGAKTLPRPNDSMSMQTMTDTDSK